MIFIRVWGAIIVTMIDLNTAYPLIQIPSPCALTKALSNNEHRRTVARTGESLRRSGKIVTKPHPITLRHKNYIRKLTVPTHLAKSRNPNYPMFTAYSSALKTLERLD